MINSKDVFKTMMEDVEEFKVNGQKWCDDNDTAAAAVARKFTKKIIKSARRFVDLTIEEASNVEVVSTPAPKVTVEESSKVEVVEGN